MTCVISHFSANGPRRRLTPSRRLMVTDVTGRRDWYDGGHCANMAHSVLRRQSGPLEAGAIRTTAERCGRRSSGLVRAALAGPEPDNARTPIRIHGMASGAVACPGMAAITMMRMRVGQPGPCGVRGREPG